MKRALLRYGWLALISFGLDLMPVINTPWGEWNLSWEAGFCMGIFIMLIVYRPRT